MYIDVSVFEGAELVFYGHCMSERELEDSLGRELAGDILNYLMYTDMSYAEYRTYSPDGRWCVVATINEDM